MVGELDRLEAKGLAARLDGFAGEFVGGLFDEGVGVIVPGLLRGGLGLVQREAGFGMGGEGEGRAEKKGPGGARDHLIRVPWSQ